MSEGKKISLLDMILYAEAEIEDANIWQQVLNSEGSPLYPGMERRRTIMRKIAATLELLKANEKEFVAIVQKNRTVPIPEINQKPTMKPPMEETEDLELESTE